MFQCTMINRKYYLWDRKYKSIYISTFSGYRYVLGSHSWSLISLGFYVTQNCFSDFYLTVFWTVLQLFGSTDAWALQRVHAAMRERAPAGTLTLRLYNYANANRNMFHAYLVSEEHSVGGAAELRWKPRRCFVWSNCWAPICQFLQEGFDVGFVLSS